MEKKVKSIRKLSGLLLAGLLLVSLLPAQASAEDSNKVIAWPAQYGQTGVKSFILSRESALHEADLGPDGDELAKKMSTFNPDERWVKVLPGFIQ